MVAHPEPSVHVVVPLKAFHRAKERLADELGDGERAALVERLAGQVVVACRPNRVTVACDDDAVERWANDLGAKVIRTDGLGLNGSVQRAVDALDHGVAVVVHGDLAAPDGLDELIDDLADIVRTGGGVVLVPDRRDDGSNVVAVPVGSGFQFSYGAGSARRHESEARRLHLPFERRRDERAAWDVDVPEDLPGPAI
ncbi:MAG: hypothetical protein ACKOYM_02195 [Actinomycetes bacterium]